MVDKPTEPEGELRSVIVVVYIIYIVVLWCGFVTNIAVLVSVV